MDEIEYASERCDNCGVHDISITGPRGSYCSRECRDAIRAVEAEEHERVRRNTQKCPGCGHWRVDHERRPGGCAGGTWDAACYPKRCPLDAAGVDAAIAAAVKI